MTALIGLSRAHRHAVLLFEAQQDFGAQRQGESKQEALLRTVRGGEKRQRAYQLWKQMKPAEQREAKRVFALLDAGVSLERVLAEASR